mgnify:CR=1 FL=1
MTEVSEASRRLKDLRERAGLSMREVSEALGWTLTRYQHYEDRYRRNFLPIELVRTAAGLFAKHGIEPRAVLELAGIESNPAGPGIVTGRYGDVIRVQVAALSSLAQAEGPRSDPSKRIRFVAPPQQVVDV